MVPYLKVSSKRRNYKGEMQYRLFIFAAQMLFRSARMPPAYRTHPVRGKGLKPTF